MGVEEIGVAAGAEIGGEDIFFTYATGEEVLVAGFPEVPVEEFFVEGFRISLAEFFDDVFAYFVAVLADGGTDGCDEVCRVCVIGFLHGFYGCFCDVSYSSPPAGMGQTDGFVGWIIEI